MIAVSILVVLMATGTPDDAGRALQSGEDAPIVLAQRGDEPSSRGSSSRGISNRGRTMSADRPRRNADGIDCHRDVRTHRIYGERVRHRHVGENCAVRVVRQAESALPD